MPVDAFEGDGVVAADGIEVLVIITSSEVMPQRPLFIVQRNVAEPTTKPVTPDVGELAVVIVPVPDGLVHAPVNPTLTGAFPAKDVAEVGLQTIWSTPAVAVSLGHVKVTIIAPGCPAPPLLFLWPPPPPPPP